jgi:hypothetical protein
MTPAQQLIADLAAAKAAAKPNTLNALWPPKIYRQDIFVVAPNGEQTLCNPMYCLTDFAGQELIAAMATRGLQCVVFPDGGPPNSNMIVLGGGWNYTAKALWLMVTPPGTGTLEPSMPFNAGMLYQYFSHGYPAHYALNNAEWELLNDLFAGGYTQTPPDVQAIMAQTQD